MRYFIFIQLVFLSTFLQAQSADFIILKKKTKTIKIFYKGSQIEFVTDMGAYRNALINNIKNDSIFLQEFLITKRPTTLGFFVIDTIGSFRFAYHYKQIKHFGRENKKFNLGGSGAALLGGGTVLTFASGVVYLADRKNFSPTLMVAGVGFALAGYFMSKVSGKGITIGKNHYRLQ